MFTVRKRLSLWRIITLAVLTFILASGVWVQQVSAFPQSIWTVLPGERLEVARDVYCEFNTLGEEAGFATVSFSKNVLSAEVFLSGFHLSYTDGSDHHLQDMRVDAYVDGINVPPLCPHSTNPDNPIRCTMNVKAPDPKTVRIRFQYLMRDDDTSDDNDKIDACFGYTVLARTR